MKKEIKKKCKHREGNYCKLKGRSDIESGCMGEENCIGFTRYPTGGVR